MNKALIIILAVVALGVFSAVIYYLGLERGQETQVQNQGNNTQTNADPQTSQDNSFHKTNDGYYVGNLKLAGYVVVNKRVCNPGDMCGETVDYVTFVFNNPGNADLNEFLGENAGNSFAGKQGIGLGCLEQNNQRVFYENFADSGAVQGEIKGPDFSKLMASNGSSPVILSMSRELYTTGSGAPDCYSHFRNFDVL